MIRQKFSECYLETEVDNMGALNLYESLGFRRTEYLPHYYLNGNAAYRMVLQLEDVFFPLIPEYWSYSVCCIPLIFVASSYSYHFH